MALRSLQNVAHSMLGHRYLIGQLAWREIAGRYRGSVIGLLWSFITPLAMLSVYTLVFGVIFQSRWNVTAAQAAARPESHADFALTLFVGLILHGFLTECMVRAPGLILANVNLVKRVVFPLEILGWTTIASALFHGAVSFVVLLCILLAVHGSVSWTVLLLPVVLAPFVLLVLGFVWFLSATGVFLRDIGQAMQPVTTVLLFLSPVLFPVTAIPQPLRALIALNPLTIPVEQARDLIIWGLLPNWWVLAVYSVVAVFIAWAGLYWFNRSRGAFADVL
ncbi:ABC transporter permease [Azospirillum sp. sgz301742]